MSQIPLKDIIPKEELLYSGHVACPGCGASLSMRLALKALGPNSIVVIPACCWSIIAGPYPLSALKVPVFHTAFETAAAVASGIRAALDVKGDTQTTVFAWAGDGGTFDIGLQALSGAAERNENIIYFCYDNEAYMNTGIQRSSATPWGAWTTTTPENRPESHVKKNIIEILGGHRVPYLATVSPAYPDDFIRKVKKAKEISGFRFIHILSPCPPGWRISSEDSIKVTRMATQCRVFPLYEVEGGVKYKLTVDPEPIPVKEYIKLQGRFRHLNEEQINFIQNLVDFEWERLLKKIEASS